MISRINEFNFEYLFGVIREYFAVELEVDVGKLECCHANKINCNQIKQTRQIFK